MDQKTVVFIHNEISFMKKNEILSFASKWNGTGEHHSERD
jgi:hypothetical protein